MLYKGNTKISEINIGNRSIGQVYKGNALLWQKEVPIDENIIYISCEIDDHGKLIRVSPQIDDFEKAVKLEYNCFYYAFDNIGNSIVSNISIYFSNVIYIDSYVFYMFFTKSNNIKLYFPKLNSTYDNDPFYSYSWGSGEIHLPRSLSGKFTKPNNITLIYDL